LPSSFDSDRGIVKQQYVGDIQDYRKVALLRHLAVAGRTRVGVCWMLTPPDDRSDGRKTQYLDDPDRWRDYSPEVFDVLKSVAPLKTATRLKHLEAGRAVPKALYFDEYVPCHIGMRRAYLEAARETLNKADLIFFDPDNGFDVPSKKKGTSDPPKFLYRDEFAATYAAGKSALVYQHFPYEEKATFIARIASDAAQNAPGAVVHVFRTPHVAFFLAVRPEHTQRLSSPTSLMEYAFRSGGSFGTDCSSSQLGASEN